MPAVGDIVTIVPSYGYVDAMFSAFVANPTVVFRVVAQHPGLPPVVGAGMPYRGGPINVLRAFNLFNGTLLAAHEFSIEDTYCQRPPP